MLLSPSSKFWDYRCVPTFPILMILTERKADFLGECIIWLCKMINNSRKWLFVKMKARKSRFWWPNYYFLSYILIPKVTIFKYINISNQSSELTVRKLLAEKVKTLWGPSYCRSEYRVRLPSVWPWESIFDIFVFISIVYENWMIKVLASYIWRLNDNKYKYNT
jgi:hypothetical protein